MQTVARITAFQSCGAFAYVYQTLHPPHEYRIGGSSCRDRFCVPCARDRSRVLATNVLNAIGKDPVRFLTLTLKSNDGPLTTQIDRLFTSFAVLRKRRIWNTNVYGGCAFIEIKWSQNASAWNVHLHCIIHGLFLPQRELSRAWWDITGDSMILDIRLVKDPQRVGRYVTKYLSKPLNNTYINVPALLDDVVTAMVGRRLCFTFGSWRGIKLSQSPEPGEWINLGSFHDVCCKAKAGDAQALEAVKYIAGSAADSLLAHIQEPRPPPTPLPLEYQQIDFEWHTPDPRF